jgi:hypothetical protein
VAARRTVCSMSAASCVACSTSGGAAAVPQYRSRAANPSDSTSRSVTPAGAARASIARARSSTVRLVCLLRWPPSPAVRHVATTARVSVGLPIPPVAFARERSSARESTIDVAAAFRMRSRPRALRPRPVPRTRAWRSRRGSFQRRVAGYSPMPRRIPSRRTCLGIFQVWMPRSRRVTSKAATAARSTGVTPSGPSRWTVNAVRCVPRGSVRSPARTCCRNARRAFRQRSASSGFAR